MEKDHNAGYTPIHPAPPSRDSGNNLAKTRLKNPIHATTDDLRQQAEKRVEAYTQNGTMIQTIEETQHLVHELQVHQVELEMQNDELRRAHEQLENSRERYFRLYDLAPVGYVTLNENGLILEANLATADLVGTPQTSLLHLPLPNFILPEDQDIFYQLRKNLFGNRTKQACELRLKKRGDSAIWVRVDASPVQGTEHGQVVAFCTLSDITAVKNAEAERGKLQVQLAQHRKMESVGRLAGGVAHNFNNLMGAVLGHGELLCNDLPPDNPLLENAMAICAAAQRSAALTRQLLAFAAKQLVQPRVLDVNHSLEGTLTLLQQLIGKNIQLVWQPGRDLWQVKIDPSQLDQMILDLTTNARDAIAGMGTITITTGNIEVGKAALDAHPESSPGEYVLITVSDTGPGIPHEILDHIFEPFFTTKGPDHGTGLGLATLHGIIRQNHGFVQVKSKPGQGVTFLIYLPRSLEQFIEVPAKPSAVMPQRGKETILIVEDEQDLLTMNRMILEKLGYKVLEAASPAHALNVVREYKDPIHLLLMDVILPRMSGRALAEKLQSSRPTMKCLFMSGYSAEMIAHQGFLAEGVAFLQKPFSMNDLAARIRATLDKDETASSHHMRLQ